MFFTILFWIVFTIAAFVWCVWNAVVFGCTVEKSSRSKIQQEIADWWKPENDPATLIDYLLPFSGIGAYIMLKLLYTPLRKKKTA